MLSGPRRGILDHEESTGVVGMTRPICLVIRGGFLHHEIFIVYFIPD